MFLRKSVVVTRSLVGVGVLCALVGCAQSSVPRVAEAKRPEVVQAVTPVGVTLQTIAGRSANAMGISAAGDVFADERGKTLYVNEMGDKFICDPQCLKEWSPAAAATATVGPHKNWSIIDGVGGVRQWAYDGKPAFTSTKDVLAGDSNGVGQGWRVLRFDLAQSIRTPSGIVVAEIPDALGYGLTDSRGAVLYTFDGDAARIAACAKPCAYHWLPVPAAFMAKPVGDFAIVNGNDGAPQWSFRGKALFTLAEDLEPGAVNGVDVAPEFKVALVGRHFVPSNMTVQNTPGRGRVWADSRGMTAYRVQPSVFRQGGNDLRRGFPYDPVIARTASAINCDDACLQTWRPVTVPEGAVASGFWTIVSAKVGTRQWAYKGFPLFTYSRDAGPGSLAGNNVADVRISIAGKMRSEVLQEQEVLAATAGQNNRSNVGVVLWAHAYP